MAIVHLSFDNGPDRIGTPRVLNALAEHGLKATFFALGRRLDAEGGDALAERVLAEGHQLGNHTYTHETPLGHLQGPSAVSELARTHAALERVGGQALFRPFGGGGALGPHLLHPAALQWLKAHRYTCVLWDCVPRDFEDPEGYVDRARSACAERERVTMVLHDSLPSATLHLPELLDGLLEDGHAIEPGWGPETELMHDGIPRPEVENFVAPTFEQRKP